MPCSAVTLSLATISAVVAVALLGISFGTDNWQYITVQRSQIQVVLQSGDVNSEDVEKFTKDPLYFSRTRGLFRVCFPKDRPAGVALYLSPVETHCMNVDYYIPDEENQFKTFSEDKQATIHMARSMIALFIVAFFFIFIAFWTGVAGCWRRSPGNIQSTFILMMMACLLSAGGMGLWHGVEYYEQQKLVEEGYYLQWPEHLKEATTISYDWSYIIAWIGVGCSLVSSLLFFGAGRCLEDERDREHAHKMQYLMPVYPQKQQYAYGYAYPGPYYHGSQYGPYNY